MESLESLELRLSKELENQGFREGLRNVRRVHIRRLRGWHGRFEEWQKVESTRRKKGLSRDLGQKHNCKLLIWVTVLALASILPEDASRISLFPPASRFAWLRIVPKWGLKTESEEEWRDWGSGCCWMRGGESEQSAIKDICMQINVSQSPPTYPSETACQYITSMRDNL